VKIKAGLKCFRDESGAIFVETLLVIPVVTILTIGILEFGNILWQRHQVETGVRDAARYWARCRQQISGVATSCSTTVARNIAFYGTPSPSSGQALRVPGWYSPEDISFTPETLPTVASGTVVVTGSVAYEGSPLVRALPITSITLTYTHEQRYLGW